ncbi:Polyubiquitin (Fragment) [Seminavis robusta]|uniref:Polyubiquitin n=1 Tax=Seminavis robusta TaxID=568900 RepID=A0A9N8HD63_9STRA
MRLFYIFQEGLAIPIETGAGLDDVLSLQNAVKVLQQLDSYETDQIHVYPAGTTKDSCTSQTPLKSTDKLPTDTSTSHAVYVHVPNYTPPKDGKSKRLSMASIPAGPAPTPKPRRGSMPVVESQKSKERPDYLKRKYYIKYGKQSIQVLMDPEEPFLQLQHEVEHSTGVPVREQKFFYNGMHKPFASDKTLRQYGLQAGGFFNLVRQEVADDGRGPRRSTFVAQGKSPDELLAHRRQSAITAAQQEEAARLQAEQQAARLEAARRKSQEEAARRKAEEEARQRAAEEARQKAAEEEEARRLAEAQRAAEAEIARLAAEEAAAEQRRLEEEEAKRVAAERAAEKKRREAAKAAEEQRRIDAEAARRAVEEQHRKELAAAAEEEAKQAEQDAQRRAAEEEAKRQREAEEKARVRILTVATPDGQILTVTLDVDDTIGDIKDAIADDCHIPPFKQVLKFKGEELHKNYKTLEQMEIPDGARLTVEPFQIPINVRLPDGKLLENIMVDPTESVGDLKEQLEAHKGCDVPADKQTLLLNRKELDDPVRKVEDYGVQPGSTLDMAPTSINVSVRTPYGKTIPVENVKLTDSIKSIKQRIAPEAGLAVEQQELSLNGQPEFPNNKTIRDCGIKDGDVLDVGISKIPITVRNTMTGKQYTLKIDPTETISSIQKKLETESGVPVNNQKLSFNGKEIDDPNKTAIFYGIKKGSVVDLEPKKIKVFVRTPDDRTLEAMVKTSDLVIVIKDTISPDVGLTIHQQHLFFNGNELPDDKTVTEMGIKDGDYLFLDQVRIPITVVNAVDGKEIPMMIDPTEPILAIKQHLVKETGIPLQSQQLTLHGKELFDPEQRPVDCGIVHGSTLELEPHAIFVQVRTPDHGTIPVRIKPSGKILAIKNKVAPETKIAVPQQVLKFKGKELPSRTTVMEHGIQDGDMLDLDVYKVPIIVRQMHGDPIQLVADPADTISKIQQQIEKESGIAVPNQKLSMNGHEFGDPEKTVAYYRIKPKAILDLEPRDIEVLVRTPDDDKKTIPVKVQPSSTIRGIKSRIAPETGLTMAQQILRYKGKLLSNDRTVRDLGLKDGDILDLDLSHEEKVARDQEAQRKAEEEYAAFLEEEKQRAKEEAKRQREAEEARARRAAEQAAREQEERRRLRIITVATPSGEVLTVTMDKDDTIGEIKDAIADDCGIPSFKQVLKYRGEELAKDYKTLEDMDIPDGARLMVEPFEIPIKVNTPDGRQIGIIVDPTESIADVKEQLEAESCGVPADNQILFFQGKELNDPIRKVENCGIKAGSVLDLKDEAKLKAEEQARRKAEEESNKRAKEEAGSVWARNKGPLDEPENPVSNVVYDGIGLARHPKKPPPLDMQKGESMEELDAPDPNVVVYDGIGLARSPNKPPREPAKKERRRSSTSNKPKKTKSSEDEDDGPVGWSVEPIKYQYTPEPMDMSTQRCWYQLEADIVPYYIRFNGWEKGEELKQHILATRRVGRNAALLEGAEPSDLKLFAPGVDEASGNEIGAGDVLPGGTSEADPILVIVKEAKGVGRKLTPIVGES